MQTLAQDQVCCVGLMMCWVVSSLSLFELDIGPNQVCVTIDFEAAASRSRVVKCGHSRGIISTESCTRGYFYLFWGVIDCRWHAVETWTNCSCLCRPYRLEASLVLKHSYLVCLLSYSEPCVTMLRIITGARLVTGLFRLENVQDSKVVMMILWWTCIVGSESFGLCCFP